MVIDRVNCGAEMHQPLFYWKVGVIVEVRQRHFLWLERWLLRLKDLNRKWLIKLSRER